MTKVSARFHQLSKTKLGLATATFWARASPWKVKQPHVGHLQAAVTAVVWPFFLTLLAGVFLYARRRARYVKVQEDWELERVPERTSCHGNRGCSNSGHTQRQQGCEKSKRDGR